MLLPHVPWRDWDETKTLLAAFAAASVEARFVGGCVRDALLSRPVTDIDLATPATPDDVISLLEKAGIRVIPTGIAHGTVTARVGERSFEITTLRRDVACDGRHAEVEFTDDWKEDALRRDFTINALSANPAGEVFDYTGGLADIAPVRVRFIGDADARIREDALRILRFFRFSAQLEVVSLDATGLKACAVRAGSIHALSGERIALEMLKLLAAPALTSELLSEMQQAGTLHAVGLPKVPASLTQLRGDAWGMLAYWLMDQPVDAFASKWKLSGAERMLLKNVIECAESLQTDLSVKAQKVILRAAGKDVFVRAVRVAMVRVGGAAVYHSMLALAESWTPPVFPVSGRDLLLRGFSQGPMLGEALKQLEARWEAEDYVPEKEALLATIKPV
jgi:poly(A) polymerase